MSEKSHENSSQRNITLEELLRLKRGERPEPQVWERFDRELRAKYMQHLIAEKPGKRYYFKRLVKGVSLVGSLSAACVALFMAWDAWSFQQSGPVQIATTDAVDRPDVADTPSASMLMADLGFSSFTLADAVAPKVLAASFTEDVRAYVVDVINTSSSIPSGMSFTRDMGVKTFERTSASDVVFVADSLSSGLEKDTNTSDYTIRYF